jgi:hypothetical protein
MNITESGVEAFALLIQSGGISRSIGKRSALCFNFR